MRSISSYPFSIVPEGSWFVLYLPCDALSRIYSLQKTKLCNQLICNYYSRLSSILHLQPALGSRLHDTTTANCSDYSRHYSLHCLKPVKTLQDRIPKAFYHFHFFTTILHFSVHVICDQLYSHLVYFVMYNKVRNSKGSKSSYHKQSPVLSTLVMQSTF